MYLQCIVECSVVLCDHMFGDSIISNVNEICCVVLITILKI